MTNKGKMVLKNLTQAQSDLLTERILRAMEMRKVFKKKEIYNDVLSMENLLDSVRYSSEAIKYGIEAVCSVFLQSGMLVQEDKMFCIAKQGEKVNE